MVWRWHVPCLEEGQQGHAVVEDGQDAWYWAHLDAEQRVLLATHGYCSFLLQPVKLHG